MSAPSIRATALSALLATAALVSASTLSLTYVPAPPNEVSAGGLTVKALAQAANGWVPPGGEFAIVLAYETGDSAVASAAVSVTLNSASVFVGSRPVPLSGNGTSGAPLTYTIGPVAANSKGSIVVTARAMSLVEDPEVMWKNISANVSVTVTGQAAMALRSHGPKVTTLETARFGDRPFPIVMADFQDIRHCTGDPVTDHADCTGTNHTAEALDEAVNSRTSGTSIWQLYQDLSFGQLFPDPTVMPRPNTADTPFDPTYNHKFSSLDPNGTCNGGTIAEAHGTPLYANRTEGGWYVLPGTQGYYGSDSNGAFGAVNPVAPTVDDGCGPTGKLVYDAASLADPDIDYNDFDTDKDGLVDFFNLVFPGVGGNTLATPTSINNIWPHSSSLEYYFTDANGLKGYVSNDQFRNQFDELMYYTDGTYRTLTTTATAFPAYVRVGPYNVNPETAMEAVSVIAHEYGHSLGLPDFYSNSFDAYGTWELMAADHFQYMAAFSRQDMGWVVPRPLQSGSVTLRESKYDTGEIHWHRPDGTPYVLTGEGIHNADVYRVGLPPRIVIDEVPSGTHAWHSGAGSNFGCPPEKGHNLDVFLPDMEQTANATAVTLTFQSLYHIEWDWDYGFVMVSDDDGETWTALVSANGATIQNSYNPNNVGCFDTHNNGITGVFAGGGNNNANPNRIQGLYPFGPFFEDQYDLTAYKGKPIVLRFSYFTDPAAVFRGWFIDDISITADGAEIYSSDFEADDERGRLFSKGWTRVSTTAGSPADHAYYLEVRDRISNDFDGKGQSDRGPPTWEAGVSMIYTDESFGYGNTGVDDHPAQTPVDSVPDPGNTSPNLNDAAFTLSRPVFNGCTHIDNYDDPLGPDELWKLPDDLKFQVTNLTGLVADGSVPASPATATLVVEVNPDCSIEIQAPVLAEPTNYENPDTDGAYTLTWTRPAGAGGPDTLQEATLLQTLVSDDAESGLGKWVNTTQGSGSFAWEASPARKHSGVNSFWARYTNGSDAAPTGNKPASLLTLKDAIVIPDSGTTNLTYWDFYIVEGDDLVILEITTDDGANWVVLSQSNRTIDPLNPDPGVATEPLSQHTFNLDAYQGKSVKIRFRLQSGGEDRAGSVPQGWWVDDIAITTDNFADLMTTANTSAALTGKLDATYYYRVKTRYPAGTAAFESGWSNIVSAVVELPNLPPVADAGIDFAVDEGATAMLSGAASSDPENGALSYAWTQTAGPPVTLGGTGPSSAAPTFTAPEVGLDTDLVFELVVTDDAGQASAPDAVTVTVKNITGGGGGDTTPPPSDLGNNSVGGALPPLTLLALGLLALRRRRASGAASPSRAC